MLSCAPLLSAATFCHGLSHPSPLSEQLPQQQAQQRLLRQALQPLQQQPGLQQSTLLLPHPGGPGFWQPLQHRQDWHGPGSWDMQEEPWQLPGHAGSLCRVPAALRRLSLPQLISLAVTQQDSWHANMMDRLCD